MAPFDQPQTSTPIKTIRKEERKLEVTVEAVEPSKIESVADKVVIIANLLKCSNLSWNNVYVYTEHQKKPIAHAVS